MENEIKEEKAECKKKGNGLFTLFACVMTGIIVFLATNLGYKASKVVDPDTSNSTSNVESNTTVETKLSETEALEIGKTLYTKAQSVQPTLLTIVEDECTNYSDGYDCPTLYNKIVDLYSTDNSVSIMDITESRNVFSYFKIENGKYIVTEAGMGYVGQCETTLTVKSIEENKITYTATSIEKLSGSPDKTFNSTSLNG